MDVYSYDNISGTILVIPPYTIAIGADVVSNGSEIPELEAYVGLGLVKYKNGVQQINVASVNSVGKLTAAGQEIYAGSLTQQQVAMVGKNTSSSGLRVAVIGASIEARSHPFWTFDKANYSRTNGIVTLVIPFSLSDKYYLPGQRIRLGCPTNTPPVEGTFSVLSCTVSPGVSTTITYSDPRANVASGDMGSATGQVMDLSSYTVPSGWQAFLNLAMGGTLDIVTIATGSTNVVTDWGTDRVQQIVDQGPFDSVIIGAGLIGNAVKGFAAGPAAIKTALVNLITNINSMVKPRTVFVETFPLCRDVAATDGTFTAANIVNKWLWRDLSSQISNVIVIPGGEAMTQNYSPYNSDPGTDIQNNWPEQIAMHSDGVHAAYGWSRVRGFAVAEGINRFMGRWVSPEMGAMPQTRQRATGIDPDGNAFPNWLAGLWGNIDTTKVTMANTGCSGNGPANSSMQFVSGRGTSTAVSTISTNPNGGTDWSITINGAGSSSGFLFKAEYAPPELLTAFNSNQLNGKLCDLLIPFTASFIDSKIIYVTVELIGVVGGQEYIIAAPQTNQGMYQMGAIGRAMDAGYSGIVKPPRFFLPTATYTSAFFRFSVREVNGSVPSGKTVIRMGPGLRLEAA